MLAAPADFFEQPRVPDRDGELIGDFLGDLLMLDRKRSRLVGRQVQRADQFALRVQRQVEDRFPGLAGVALVEVGQLKQV